VSHVLPRRRYCIAKTTNTARIKSDTNRCNTFPESTVSMSKLAASNICMTDGGIEAEGVGNRSDKTPHNSVVLHCAQLTHILPAGRHLPESIQCQLGKRMASKIPRIGTCMSLDAFSQASYEIPCWNQISTEVRRVTGESRRFADSTSIVGSSRSRADLRPLRARIAAERCASPAAAS
jgi:hypothetical protein